MEVGAGDGVRLGVLDVGSNTVHLLVVDAHHGAAPRSAYTYKNELRLAEFLTDDGEIAAPGVEALAEFVGEASILANQVGAEEMLAFATSAIREAANGEAVLSTVFDRTGVELEVLSGPDEARLTFLAVRRWFGWSSGRLLVLDIGGGSLEVAVGVTEEPDSAFSLPLGAGRLTREFLTHDPPSSGEVKQLRKQVRTLLAGQAEVLESAADASHVVGTSKTFRQMARLGGAAPSSAGPYVQRLLRRDDLAHWVPKLAGMSARQRASLPGVSEGRAPQLLAGAIVAEAVMDAVETDTIEICPWALREGVILRRLDWMGGE
jgi:exopolyphosphatase/guanosine-5'-triphosphate,3'-diphosphate pyrophosphatase